MSDSLPPGYLDLLDVVRGYQRSRAVTVAADLGVADLLRDGARDAEELAAATGTHATTLYRLLRALAAIGVFAEAPDGRFSLTATGQFLRRDHPLSIDPAARMFGADHQWEAWGALAHSVRTGENAAQYALGTDVWEYRRRHPEQGEIFDAAMRTFSRADSARMLAAHDFGRYATVADVGGGTGAVLAAVLTAHPQVQGVLVDQEYVVAGAPPLLREAGVADRTTIVAGSFFHGVPAGADAYLLVRILHDWPDDDAVRILRTIRGALAPDGRVIIVDAVVGPPGDDSATKFLDLMMLVSAGGRERTRSEWEGLLRDADLRLVGATRASPTRHVLEVAAT
jgi:SAM-dependent methyltransferase